MKSPQSAPLARLSHGFLERCTDDCKRICLRNLQSTKVCTTMVLLSINRLIFVLTLRVPRSLHCDHSSLAYVNVSIISTKPRDELFFNFFYPTTTTTTNNNCTVSLGFHPWEIRVLSHGKASSDRVALPNLPCMLGV